MSRGDTALLVVDVQERLLPAIRGSSHIVWNIGRLLDAAEIFGVRRLVTEQYPQGLGQTVPELREKLPPASEKTRFSCGACATLWQPLPGEGIRKILVTGIETHVCVLQTTLDLLTCLFDVYVAVDAVGSRAAIDHDTALRRMSLCGAYLTTTESAIFEWCEDAADDQFRQVSRLIRQPPPSPTDRNG